MENLEKLEILVVDDDATNLKLLSEILREEYKVYPAPTGEMALAFLQNKSPDLILLDVAMPGMDGYEVLARIKENPDIASIPVIFLTGQEGRDKEQEALTMGAVDYILKPISPGIVKARVALHLELETYRKSLEDVVVRRTIQLAVTQDAILDVMANMTSIRDNETGAHIKRTTLYVQLLCDNLMRHNLPGYQLDRDTMQDVVKSAKLHDIGKVAVPDNILLKPGRLTAEEFEAIKLHTVFGAQILDDAMDELGDTASVLTVARDIIASHHEKWDGSGYPNALAGQDIPLAGRIMAVADVYDALISRRPYKDPFPHEKAMEIILKDAGTHFDPTLVELSRETMEEFDTIAQTHSDE